MPKCRCLSNPATDGRGVVPRRASPRLTSGSHNAWCSPRRGYRMALDQIRADARTAKTVPPANSNPDAGDGPIKGEQWVGVR